MDELPFGTRGGLAVRSEFPVDGNYVVKVELAGARARAAPARDHGRRRARARCESLGGRRRQADEAAEDEAARRPRPLEFSLPLKAGPRLVGVAFVQRTEARDEATLRPRMRSRGTQPAIASVTISGPYNVTAPGDSPSRRRIFVCRPTATRPRSCRAPRADPLDARAPRLPPPGRPTWTSRT